MSSAWTPERRRKYQLERFRNMPPAMCHPDRREHCRGLCRSCYRSKVQPPGATCHPERRPVAHGLCLKCYNDLPANKQRAVRVRRLKKYKLTQEEFDRRVAEQGGVCAICKDPEPLVVDHDHRTTKVRGLLCRNCNAAIGLLRDSPTRAIRAAAYLEVTL